MRLLPKADTPMHAFPIAPCIAPSILATVDADRLQRGVTGLTAGTYTMTLTRTTETGISAYVANGDNTTYSVTLTDGRSFCGCGDSMYRGKVCKHATALALYTIRAPAAVAAPLPLNLPLAKVRRTA